MDCSIYFILNSGNTFAIIHHQFGEAGTWFYQIILDLNLNIESRVSNKSNFVSSFNCCYAMSGDLLAIGLIVTDIKPIFPSIDYPVYESLSFLLKVFDCSSQITEVFCINVTTFTQYDLEDLCFLDNNKLAIITSGFEYITIDIRSGVREVKELNFIPTVDNLHHYVTSFVNMRYEGIDNEIVLIVTDTGFILNLNKEESTSLIDKIQQNFQNINIVSSQLCIFNKWIYIFCGNHFIYVYDPFHKVVVHEFNAIRGGLDIEVIDDWFNEKICIDWFGDELFRNTKDKIIVQLIFRHKCFSLKYIARKALFKYHSENDLKKLKLGKKINQLIFDNIY